MYPQMSCRGPYCDESYNYNVNSIQCKNTGFDGSDVNWRCTAYIDNKSPKYDYTVNNFQVMCKGYNYPNDPYILHGSCSVEYTVDKKFKIETYQEPRNHVHTQTHTVVTDSAYTYDYGDDNDAFLAFLICLLVLVCLIPLCTVPFYRTVNYFETPRRVYFWQPYYYTLPSYPVYSVLPRRYTSTTTTATSMNTPYGSVSRTPSSTFTESKGASDTRRR
jgi:hypothetical protein